MALKAFGVLRKEDFLSLRELLLTSLISTSKNVNLGGTFGTKIFMLKC